MIFFKKRTINEFLAGLEDGARITADAEGGWVRIKLNDQSLFEGTLTDSTVVFISIMKLMGKKNVKKLLRLKDR